MKSKFVLLVAVFSLAILRPAGPRVTADAQSLAKSELLALHQADRRAHFNRDVEALVQDEQQSLSR
jgi:hypothetical protein